MKLKRIMAFTLAACLMMSSMTVLAADVKFEDGQYDGTSGAGTNNYVGTAKPDAGENGNCKENTTFAAGDTWTDGENKVHNWNATENKWDDPKEPEEPKDPDNNNGNTTTPPTSEESSPSDTVSVSGTVSASGIVAAASAVSVPAPAPAPDAPKVLSRVDIMNIVTRAETIALQATARDAGFADMVDMQIAAAKNMSAGEYYNNAVVVAPGIEEATPVAQGGGIIINGVATNVMATISKVDVAFVDSVRASVEGTVLNVVDVRFPAVEATINFYMPGVAADANIAAVQYVDGAWVDVEVAEVRADHVVLNLKQNGKVAFLSK